MSSTKKTNAPKQPSGAGERTLPAIGAKAPNFRLEADDGETYALRDLKGERFVLYFYPRDSTPGCTVEACDFRDRRDAFAAADTRIFGVSGDSIASHQRFRDKQALTFPLLSDPGNEVARAYGAYGQKNMYGKIREGIIRSTFVVGADGRIEAVYSPVKVKGHADAVLTALGAGG
ncbi:MAG: thioredoxin-dependent thiol peroxidase [Nannocystaceae bacterium]